MKNQVATDQKQQIKPSAKDSARKVPTKTRDQQNKPNQKDASDLPSGWAFAT